MSCFTGDHLKTVVKTLLPMPCHEHDRALVIAKPSQYRVHTSHFAECDKVLGQGGKPKLKHDALPIPFARLFCSASNRVNGVGNSG